MREYVIKAGQIVKIGGIPVELRSDTVVSTETDLEAIGVLIHDGDSVYLVASAHSPAPS